MGLSDVPFILSCDGKTKKNIWMTEPEKIGSIMAYAYGIQVEGVTGSDSHDDLRFPFTAPTMRLDLVKLE